MCARWVPYSLSSSAHIARRCRAPSRRPRDRALSRLCPRAPQEYCPVAFRPRVHVVASSHVLAPWRWPKYYGQDWLRVVTPEHVRYSLEVWGRSPPAAAAADDGGALAHDGKLPGSYAPVAQFALNPYPIHHPEGMDVAVIHLKEEEEALKRLGKLGVRPLHLPTMHEFETSNDPVFEPGERVLFQGFEVYEANTIDQDDLTSEAKDSATRDDERMFHPYSSLGVLDRVSPDRFLAQTKAGPLPEGEPPPHLCLVYSLYDRWLEQRAGCDNISLAPKTNGTMVLCVELSRGMID